MYRFLGSTIPQQINFVGNLEEDDSTIMFFIAEKKIAAKILFCLDSLIVTE